MSVSSLLYQLLIGPIQILFEVIYGFAADILNNYGLAVIVLSLAMNFMLMPLYKRADAIQDGEHPEVSFLCFVADSRKSGGAYRTVTDRVKRIDPVENKVILCSTRASGVNEYIQIEDIFDIQGDFVDNMDSD